MNAGLRALLAGAIDYAGAYPPASLGLEQSAENYFRYRKTPETWMLGRFVCPAMQLDELAAFVERRSPPAEVGPDGVGDWSIAAVLPAGATVAEGRRNLNAWLPALRRSPLAAKIGGIEIRLPDELTLATTFGELRDAAEPLLDELAAEMLPGAIAFIESPVSPAVPSAAHAKRDDLICWVAKAVAGCAKKENWPAGRLAFKLRMGGQSATHYLSSAELARVLGALREHRALWKATAGLHHPMFHYDAAIGGYAAGFINVLSAAVLAEAHHLPEFELQSILEEENVASFTLTENGIRWRGRSATIDQIAAARRRAFLSFGSCSFDEPVAGLKALGWL